MDNYGKYQNSTGMVAQQFNTTPPASPLTMANMLEQISGLSAQLSERMTRLADSLGGAIPRGASLQGASEKNPMPPSVMDVLRYISSTLETALNESERAQSHLGRD